jgi:predicted DNA-binding transcriptional regulator AlpA
MSIQSERETTWTPEAVRALGMTTDVETAALILGIGRTLAYDLVREDKFPVRLIRLGRRVLVPVPELLRLLGVDRG